jgi:ketosteroid isomerase-like protein
MSQENVEVVRAVYEEWAKGNFRAGADLYDPLVLMVPGGDSTDVGHYLGPEAMREYMLRLLPAWKTYTMAAEELIEAGDSVVVAVRQRGLGRESGIPTDMRLFAVWTFRGRAVIRLETFVERAEALEAVGLSE